MLEGLGNAKTVRNNNSSRFGKFVTMRFDDNNKLVGAEVQTFLLEKSRVVATTASGERNYHVFYHVLCGAGLLQSSDPDWARLLNRSGCTVIPRVNDVEEYHQIVEALRNIGVGAAESTQIQVRGPGAPSWPSIVIGCRRLLSVAIDCHRLPSIAIDCYLLQVR